MTAPQRDGPEARRARRRVIAMLLARGDIGASLLREAEGTELAADSGFAAPERAVEPSERLDPAASGHDAPDG